MSFSSPSSSYVPPPVVPEAPAPPPLFGTPQDQKPAKKSMQQSFLGGTVNAMQNPTNTGTKSLLGGAN